MKLIISIMAILLMILIHEWGHFIAGRICKIPVYEFSIGFGPKIYQKKGKKETIYSVRAIPLGGYCAFDKEDKTGTLDIELNKQKLWKRMFIFIAGPLMNIITCFIIILGVSAFIGNPTPVPIVSSVEEGYSSYGILKENDEILAVNGIQLNRDTELLSKMIIDSKGKEIKLEILRDGKTIEREIIPNYNNENNTYVLGIIQKQINIKTSIPDAFMISGKTIVHYTTSIFDVLGGLFTGKYSVNQMSSIVGVVNTMSSYASPSNLPMYLTLCAYISFNLGLMNLLPIPGLDGSKILFGIFEGITKKRIPEKIETYITLASMSLLLLLSGYLMFHDLFNIFK